jgi:hypothetical protein
MKDAATVTMEQLNVEFYQPDEMFKSVRKESCGDCGRYGRCKITHDVHPWYMACLQNFVGRNRDHG